MGKRDALLQQLRELEDTAVKRTPEQLARERYALELEAARVLLALDERGASTAATAKAPAAAGVSTVAVAAPARGGLLAERPALRGFLWGIGTMSALGLLLFSVSDTARTRDGGTAITGDMQTPGSEEESANETAIRKRLARNPDDLEARMALARLDLTRRDLKGVWNETQYVLARSPGHPEALSYAALVRLSLGHAEEAEKMLKQALAGDPNLLEAYLHLSLVYARMGRLQEADATMAEAMRRFPQRAEELRALQAQIRGQAEKREAATTSEGKPPAGTQAQAPAAASAGGHEVAGTLDLDPALKGQVAPGSMLFVIVREAGVDKGPPVAVKRLATTSFPMSFSLTDADSMAGEPLPSRLRIEARVDSDGNPLTRSPDDPSARVDDVKVGTRDLHLVLKR
jgi:cytochrome c-type biogenesis protein CcmH